MIKYLQIGKILFFAVPQKIKFYKIFTIIKKLQFFYYFVCIINDIKIKYIFIRWKLELTLIS